MSNRAVSTTYRTIIDDVIANVRQDFEDMGIEREVLEELQRSWEAKIVATGVADFEGAPAVTPRSRRGQQSNGGGASSSTSNQNGGGPSTVKLEDGLAPSVLMGSGNKVARTNGSSDVKKGESSTAGGSQASTSAAITPSGNAGAMAIEGLLSSNGDQGSKRKRATTDENEIGSDLDDSDEEELDGKLEADGNEDMILCLYDKVQRVRNRWKCALKDGVASIDGRDYVFSKMASELEW